ncbi:MAG: glycoside hydrolase family 13 [Chloroflexi bacterium]|nr:MAG: glycoside hydrolase family 13 [Chloroflexota bacterium]
MITKHVNPRDHLVLVTFEVPASIWAEQITLVGDFNEWNPTAHPLVQTHANENWHITLALEPNRTYRFRYLIDGHTWSNDRQADEYGFAEDGLPCSVIVTHLAKEAKPAASTQPTLTQTPMPSLMG